MASQLAILPALANAFKINSAEPGLLENLLLTNHTPTRLAFKIKTTVPVYLGVRPNMGVMEPKSSFFLPVYLIKPPHRDSNKKNESKLIIEYLCLSEKEASISVADLFSQWREIDMNRLMSVKLRFKFDKNSVSVQLEMPKKEVVPYENKIEALDYDDDDFDDDESEIEQLQIEVMMLRTEIAKLNEVFRLRHYVSTLYH